MAFHAKSIICLIEYATVNIFIDNQYLNNNRYTMKYMYIIF